MQFSWVCRAAFSIAALVFAFSSTSRAQEPYPKPALIPGSADAIHDVLGIAIGMTCDEAVAKGAKISAQAEEYKVRHGSLLGAANIDGHRVFYKSMNYQILARTVKSTIADQIDFKCVGDMTGGEIAGAEIFEVSRRLKFIKGVEVSPSVAALRGLFQEKYGVPTVEFGPLVLAIMFNKAGVIQGKSDACGVYRGNNYYLKDYADVDSKKCSYALTFTATEARDQPGTVTEINILIRDYLRLENSVRAVEKHRIETTPVASPKL
jgi:hypothetical protein